MRQFSFRTGFFFLFIGKLIICLEASNRRGFKIAILFQRKITLHTIPSKKVDIYLKLNLDKNPAYIANDFYKTQPKIMGAPLLLSTAIFFQERQNKFTIIVAQIKAKM